MGESGVNSHQARTFAAVIALLGWLALAAQLVLTVQIFAGQGGNIGLAVWRYVGFFTILSNILVAITMTRVALGLWPGGKAPGVSALTGVAFTIATVGVSYHFILSGVVPALAWLPWSVDRTLHYVVPLLSVLFWLACVPKAGLTYRDPFLWLVFPLAYMLYAMLRGSLDGWYAYFFIDVSTIGYGMALRNAAMLSAVMLVAGLAIVAAVRLAKR